MSASNLNYLQGVSENVGTRPSTSGVDGAVRPVRVGPDAGPEWVEEALQEGQNRGRELVEKRDCIVLELDVQGRISFASPALERLLGYATEELCGRPILDLMHPEDIAAMDAGFRDASVGRSPSHEFRVKARNGAYCWVSARMRLMVVWEVKPTWWAP